MSELSGEVGELPALAAFDLLTSDPAATLVDVRTAAEWAYVGAPDLAGIGKDLIFLEWQTYPSGQPAPDFARRLKAKLTARSVATDAPLLFLCRSGVRSLAAARAMSAHGYSRCLNVVGGFEGPCDAARRRGGIDGWKARGLPWAQS